MSSPWWKNYVMMIKWYNADHSIKTNQKPEEKWNKNEEQNADEDGDGHAVFF